MTTLIDDSDSADELLDVDHLDGDGAGGELQDRGDDVVQTLSPEALQAVLAGAGEVDQQLDEQADDAARAGSGIPRARFNEVNNERKELLRKYEEAQAELGRLRGPGGAAPVAAPAAPAFDADAAEEAYAQALLDGDTKGAAAVRRQINAHIQAEAVQQYAAMDEQRQTTGAVDQVVAQTLQHFPYLDTADGEQALQIIIATSEAAIARGVSPPQALTDAVNAIAPRFAPSTPHQGLRELAPRSDTRIANAMKRNAADSLLQPAAVHAGIGNRAQGGQVDVAELSDDAFDNLPEAERKRLRGD